MHLYINMAMNVCISGSENTRRNPMWKGKRFVYLFNYFVPAIKNDDKTKLFSFIVCRTMENVKYVSRLQTSSSSILESANKRNSKENADGRCLCGGIDSPFHSLNQKCIMHKKCLHETRITQNL